MRCGYYEAGECRSCTSIEQPYPAQLAEKQRRASDLLGVPVWLPEVPCTEAGYRNKAKMVVGGTREAPTLGILSLDGDGVDLRGCPICAPGILAALPVLASFITDAGLTPYDVPHRRGELKHLLVTESPDGELMVRFVMRSRAEIDRIRKHLPALREALPALAVATVNLLPEHKAVTEGHVELLLTERAELPMRLAGLGLRLRPQSFFQVNTPVAEQLYEQARAWADAVQPSSVWDLYCGVGGFALALTAPDREVLGVELSAEAIESARSAATDAGLTASADIRFEVGDATSFALAAAPDAVPDLVVVNPPRRGIGVELAGWLERSAVRHVIYSSCNVDSLARDLAAMPSLAPVEGRVLDMFPNTRHFEVAVLLERR